MSTYTTDISELFEQVLDKPELYLGIRSVSRLHIYMQGLTFGLLSVNPEYDAKVLWEFYDWVDGQYNFNTSHSWADKVLFMNSNDEYKAFNAAKKLWKKYKTKRFHKL